MNMLPKEQAIADFKEMINLAWPLKRFTERERENLNNMLYWMEHAGRLTGNYNQRWEQLQSAYNAFLFALDYKAMGWREPERG
ncbi:MAG: hypothetical protein AB7D36_05515 [Oscillospiraceae bacterium]